MTRRKSNNRDQSSRYSSNSSESSFSSANDVESCDSDVSSDDLDLGLNGTSEAQQKFKRLRRIFLNRPTKSKKKEIKQRRKREAIDRDTSQLELRLPKSGATERQQSTSHRRNSTSSNSSSGSDARAVYRPSKTVTSISSARPLQAAIEQHTNALWEQMKRHSAQRYSTANQVQSMLEQAADELQFLKKQEERALESQMRLIRESYTLRLEVLQQQYLNTVAEIEDEMYISIQKRQEECDATILAAAKRLQDQTQRALLKDLSMMNNDPTQEHLDSSSSTASSSASHSKVHRHRNARLVRHDPLSSSEQIARVAPMLKQVSPVSQQRAKLQALEEKLAAFSPESLHRVKTELATPIRRSKAEKSRVKPKWTQTTPSIDLNYSPNEPEIRDADEWRASPLSPLREGPSYWKNGISLEIRRGEDRSDGPGESSKIEQVDETSTSKTTRRKAPASLMSRRFLRPEEEEELHHLRTSIGLAKDWMAKNSHT